MGTKTRCDLGEEIWTWLFLEGLMEGCGQGGNGSELEKNAVM